jgi:hypothetical protein
MKWVYLIIVYDEVSKKMKKKTYIFNAAWITCFFYLCELESPHCKQLRVEMHDQNNSMAPIIYTY